MPSAWSYRVIRHNSAAPGDGPPQRYAIHEASFSLLLSAERGGASPPAGELQLRYVVPAAIFAPSHNALRTLLQSMEQALDLPILTPRDLPAAGYRVIRREGDLRFRYALYATQQHAALSAYLDGYAELAAPAFHGQRPAPLFSPSPYLVTNEDPGSLRWDLAELRAALDLPVFDADAMERAPA